MLVTQKFGGPGFLGTVRSLMNGSGGMLGARDGAFRYVFLDADFFSLNILQRSPDQTFTDAAIASGATVVANGQVFPSYCLLPGSCPVQWRGEVISAHTTLPGDPPHTPSFRFFGQTDGASTDAYVCASGDPSSVTPPLANAIGRLLPLVENKAVSATYALDGSFWIRPVTCGKTVFGIARDINAVLVLVQQDGETGLMLKDLAQLIADANIDQAVLADGSNSATLVINGTIEVTPGHYFKDRAIPVGPMFIQNVLVLNSEANLVNSGATTDPSFMVSFSASGVQGTFSLTGSGIDLQLTSLGVRSDTGADLADDLGVSVPVTLQAADAQLAPSTPMTGGALSLDAQATTAPVSGGIVTGRLMVGTSGGSVTLDLNWPLDR